MLERKTNLELIELAASTGAPSELELELAERLGMAITEIDRLTQHIARLETADGKDTRG